MDHEEILQQLSAEQLEKLLEAKKKAEREENIGPLRESLARKQAEMKTLQKRCQEDIRTFKKEISAIKAELSGRKPSQRSSGPRRTNISKMIIEFVRANSPCSTKALRAMMVEKGIDTKNINQSVSYLVRNNRLVNTGTRGHYQIV